MNRLELIARLIAKHPELKIGKIESAVNAALDEMKRVIVDGERIEIRGFGSFSVVTRKARTARNPKTGERLQIPERSVPHFKPGKELKGRVQVGLAPGAKRAGD